MFRSPKILNLFKTVTYYLVVIAIACILNKLDPGGVCTPGPVMIVLLFAPLITLILVIRNFYLLSKNKKEQALSLYVHVIVLLRAMIFF
jgi:high-affinity K+ transport system ATPase subunit B